MSELGFDDDKGIRTQNAINEYIKLVEEYNALQQAGVPEAERIAALEKFIQEARDKVEEQQGHTREFFSATFHHLDKVSTQELKDGLRRYQRYLDGLPSEFSDPPFVEHRKQVTVWDRDERGTIVSMNHSKREYRKVDPPLVQQRRFLGEAIYEMKEALASRGVEQSPVEEITTHIQRQIEIEARLHQQCEDDVQKYPDQEESIRRSYRKAIDAFRDRS